MYSTCRKGRVFDAVPYEKQIWPQQLPTSLIEQSAACIDNSTKLRVVAAEWVRRVRKERGLRLYLLESQFVKV